MVLVALCLTIVLAASVAAYVAVSARSMELSNRSFCTTASRQLAEIGIDESLWNLNQALDSFNSGSAYGWSGWTIAGNTASKQLTGFATNIGIPGSVTVQIVNFNPQSYNPNDPTTFPVITASGTSQMPDGIAITQQLQVKARPAALFANAVGAYTSTSFTINWAAALNSYDSSLGDYSTQTPTDQAIVSAPSVSVNSANVYGYVATTGSAPTYTSSGTVKRADTPGAVSRDPKYILTNANQNLFDIRSDANLPGTYAGLLLPGTQTLSPAVLSRYQTVDLTLSGSNILTIDGPVIIVASGNLSIQDTASIVVTSRGTAQIIVAGSTYVGGNGINNTTKLPAKFALISRSSGSYGNGSYGNLNNYTAAFQTSVPFYGVIYVPLGSLQVYGTTTLYGSLVANVMDQGYGTSAIHYDLSLRKAYFSALSTPYDIAQWIVSN